LIILAVISALFISSTRVRVVEALSITTLGVPITQNFDTLATTGAANTWTDDSTLPGWYSQFELTTTNPTTYRADAGASNTGAIYSWGTGTATERALGSVSSGTPGTIFNALKLTNNSGSSITSFDISYLGEQWRNGGNTSAQQLDFQYQVAAAGAITDANTPTTGWTDFDPLDFASPTVGATAAALDGNAAANRTARSATLMVTVNAGQEIWLRWKDINDAGNDHGLAIDDFSVTPQGAGGGGTPALGVNDVTQAETNAGTTTFTFTVSLTAPALVGGVAFDIATADGTAQDGTPGAEDNDYVAKSETGRTITAGNTTADFTVTVNGDLTPELNETFFVNVTNITGANAGDVQGLGTISNDDVVITPVHNIQGSGTNSPLVGHSVTTTGIVTGFKSNGFFLQAQDTGIDGNSETSEGIFVFTSSAPPVAAAIGNSVKVTGTVQEFRPAADPDSPPATELISPIVVQLSTGNPLPAPILVTAAETTQASETTNPLDSLEEYEGMRVTVVSLTVSGASQGTITEASATVTSNGVFLGVVSGVARPFREPGIAMSDPLPAGAPVTIPRFDENPERIRVDSDAQPGTTALDVAAGTIVKNITGPLDYAFRCYTIDPDAATPPTVGTQPGSTPAPAATTDEFTVASFNLERFFNTTDDPGTGDPILTTAAFNRRIAKASLIIRTVQRLPDVIGVEEVENLATLQAVATQINSDVVGGGGTDPMYQAYLVEGNDIGGIDVGFLVKSSRISVVDVTQLHATTTYLNPNTGAQDLLNDRPPLVLRATCPRPLGGSLPFTVIVNHLRSLSGADDNTVNGTGTAGARVRAKRRAQAEDLAGIIQARQIGDPNELIITVGDLNAFNVNDGYVDVIGTIKGTPAPASQVTLASSDLVNPDLTDLIDILPAPQQYSYNFDGNAQVLDHIILNHEALAFLTRFAYARNDSDFAVKNYESTNELRLSDHDQPVAYFNLTAANPIVSGRITDTNGAAVPGSVVQLSGTQSRKTITDVSGNYRFDSVETGGSYTVTPARANYVFSPASRSFSQLGNRTEAAFTGSVTGDAANPLDTAEYFVRQQYVDLLGREPDESGFNYWSNQILACGEDTTCANTRRGDVAGAFFIEQEFQQTGSFIYNVYSSTLGREPAFAEYSSDRQQLVGGANLDAEKTAFAQSFVQRADFTAKYQANTTADSFVDALIQNALSSGVDLSGERPHLLSSYASGGNTVQSRAAVVRALADTAAFRQSQYNPAFVLTEYFGYLRRDPDAGGFHFWLDILNNSATSNYRGMVCSFITSTEYQRRFSAVVSHSNAECGP
jgi:hypothetical protein